MTVHLPSPANVSMPAKKGAFEAARSEAQLTPTKSLRHGVILSSTSGGILSNLMSLMNSANCCVEFRTAILPSFFFATRIINLTDFG